MTLIIQTLRLLKFHVEHYFLIRNQRVQTGALTVKGSISKRLLHKLAQNMENALADAVFLAFKEFGVVIVERG